MQKFTDKKHTFQVSSDFEAYEKVMDAKKNYEKNGISYSVEESYAKGIKRLKFKKV